MADQSLFFRIILESFGFRQSQQRRSMRMRTVMMTAMTMMPAGPKPPLSFILGFSAGPDDAVFLFSSDEVSLSLWGTPMPFVPSSCKN